MQGYGSSRKRNTVLSTNPLLLKGQALEFVDSIKYLGLTISWDVGLTLHLDLHPQNESSHGLQCPGIDSLVSFPMQITLSRKIGMWEVTELMLNHIIDNCLCILF